MPDEPKKTDPQLTEKIRELESLLAAQEKSPTRPAPGRPADIPILDELVEPAPDEPDPGAPSPDITALAERLEEKFAMELDEIIRLLKGNLKANIMDELRSLLSNEEAGKSKPGGDGPEGSTGK
jgi:hypothetical protein